MTNTAITENTITDARATVNGGVVHRAEITVFTEGAKVTGRRIHVTCGAVRYRNTGGRSQNVVVAPLTAEITCTRCRKA
jgi:hypothetical protein